MGYADVQVNLKDINDNAPLFPHGVYLGNVTENGTAGMVVMTMTAVDYDDPNEGSNAKLTYSIEKNVIDENTGMPIFEIESETGVIKTAVPGLDREKTPDYSIQVVAMDGGGLKGSYLKFLKNFYLRYFQMLNKNSNNNERMLIVFSHGIRNGYGVHSSQGHKRHASSIYQIRVVHRSGRDGRHRITGRSHIDCNRPRRRRNQQIPLQGKYSSSFIDPFPIMNGL